MTAPAGIRTAIPPRLLVPAAVVLVGLVAVAVAIGGPLAGLAVIGGVAALWGVAYLPGVVFAAYLLLSFYKGAIQPALPVDATVVLAVLCVLQGIPLLVDRGRRPISGLGLVLFVAMSLLVLAGVLWAPDAGLAVDRAVRWWTLVFLPITIAALRVGSDERYVRQFLWTFFAMGSFVAVIGVSQLSSVDRVTVLDANTIQVARAALLVPLLGVTFVLSSKVGIAKAALIGLVPAAMIVAVGSGSRGPLLFFGLLVIFGLVARAGRLRTVTAGRWLPITAIGLASLIGIGLVAAQLPSTALNRFTLLGEFIQSGLSGELNTSVGDTSAGNRVVLYELATELFAEHPLLGVGTSGFEALSERNLAPAEVEAWPHNSILQVAAEFGIVGLGIFLTLVILALVRPLPYGAAGTALRVVFLFFLLNGMVSGDIMSDRETWGILMLLLCLGPVADPASRTTERAPATTVAAATGTDAWPSPAPVGP